MTDGLIWGNRGPWTKGWQQQGQQAEGVCWQKKSEVSTKSLTQPVNPFLIIVPQTGVALVVYSNLVYPSQDRITLKVGYFQLRTFP